MDSKLKLSSKLVGRDDEIDQLQELYRSLRDGRKDYDDLALSSSINSFTPSSKFSKKTPSLRSMFVEGLSGVGKSFLVETALVDIVQSDGNFFCKGKFDQNRFHRPFSAIADALSTLCTRAHTKFGPEEQREIKGDLRAAFGPDGIEAVGNLVPVFSECMNNDRSFSPCSDSSAASSVASFSKTKLASRESFFELTLLLGYLIKTIVGNDVFVLFIDDLQWATIESLEVIEDFLTNLKSVKFMFVGAFRSDEVTEHHCLTKLLNDHSTKGHPILTLKSMGVDDIAEYIASLINMKHNDVLPLAEFIQERTQGNIFHVKQYLEYLHLNGHLYFSIVKLSWEWEDLSTIQDSSIGVDDIDAVVAKKILKLPQDTVVAMMIASCLGSRFDVDILQILVEKDWRTFAREECAQPREQIESILWPAVEENLLEEITGSAFSSFEALHYKFVHDKVQSSTFSLIGDTQKEYHFAIGSRLRDFYKGSATEPWMLVLTADQLSKGKEMLKDQAEKDEVSELIIQAARELRKASSFESAAEFCRNAIELLGEESWERCYSITLQVCNLGAEMEFCSGSQDECEQRVQQILEKARCLKDTYNAYWILVENLASQRRFSEAVDAGYLLLKQMKLSRLPSSITTPRMLLESFSVLKLLEGHSAVELLEKSDTDDDSAAFYIKLLVQLSVHSWFAEEPHKIVFLALRATRMSLKYGYTPSTSTALVICAFVVLVFSNHKFDEARRLSGVAMEIRKRWRDLDPKTWTEYIFNCFIVHWEPDDKLGNLNERLSKLHNTCVGYGNTSLACMTGASTIFYSFYDGSLRLDRLALKAAHSCAEQTAYKKLNFLASTRIFRQVILNLAGRSKDPLVLEGEEIKDWDTFKREIVFDYAATRQTIVMPMILCYLFGDFKEGKKLADWTQRVWKGDYPSLVAVFVPFFRFLTYTRRFQCQSVCTHGNNWMLRRKARCDLKLVQTWARGGSLTVKTLVQFLEAEWKVVEKRSDYEVQEGYDKAIHALNELGLQHIAAIASESLGDYFVKHNRVDLATSYYIQASEGYRRWGALAKVRDISEKHSFSSGTLPHTIEPSEFFAT